MSEQKIHGALVQGVIDAAFGLPCVFEEDPTVQPTAGEPWMRAVILPGATDVGSNGSGGMDNHLGILQLDFSVAPNEGVAALLGYADAARSFFVAGKRLYHAGQCVLITRAERSQVRAVDGWARVTVSIYYSAYSTRSEV